MAQAMMAESSSSFRELAGDEGEAGSESPAGDAPMRRASSRLLRAASTSFTGGATVLPPQPLEEAVTPRQSIRRLQRSNTVQQRMMHEVLARYQHFIAFFMLSLVLFLLVMVALFYSALYAAVEYADKPCDQPLQYYVVTSFLVGQVTPKLVKKAQQMPWAQRPRYTVAVSMAGSVPGWIVILWGFMMTRACKTCQETNPVLYSATRNFIYGQIVLFLFTTVFFSVGFTAVLAYWHTLATQDQKGCEGAVHALVKVEHGHPELLDPDDGQVLECPICAEAFEEPRVVVRTKCGHHFHEECLARWCKNHVDCPMCRAVIGEPDEGSP